MMKTDIKDTDQGYEITMNLPGVKKEDVKAELKDGYLTISATSNSNKDEIKAKFENGALTLTVPKKEEKPAVEDNKKYIAIEG